MKARNCRSWMRKPRGYQMALVARATPSCLLSHYRDFSSNILRHLPQQAGRLSRRGRSFLSHRRWAPPALAIEPYGAGSYGSIFGIRLLVIPIDPRLPACGLFRGQSVVTSIFPCKCSCVHIASRLPSTAGISSHGGFQFWSSDFLSFHVPILLN